NKQLGLFRLDGIAPAPRGIPQIEVIFDIDANGIVNVTAKDRATNKEQHVTITSGSNMSKEDIDKAVKDAEQYAAEDKKRREEVDAKNEAENLCYAVEKLIKDSGDKIDGADKDNLNSKVAALREKIKGGNIDEIKNGKEELQKVMYEVSTKLYQQAAPQGENVGQNGEQAQSNANGSENVYNADYKDVDPENK
ncbi:MAG: Hsp70 family protein, partial [Clostridia bacterium]|nr:Hsp70 family protein [Clostridia bacterium]